MNRAVFVLALTALLALIGCGSSGTAASRTAEPTHVPAPPSASFIILSSKAVWEYGRFVVIGEVKNIGTVAAGVQVEAIARDANGTLLDSTRFFANGGGNNLVPGGTSGFNQMVTKDPAAVTIEVKVVGTTVWRRP